jgi:hypothetical protein
MISEGDPVLEKELRQMSIYDFYFRTFTLVKNAKRAANKSEEDLYGFRAR